MTNNNNNVGYSPRFSTRLLQPRYWPAWLLLGLLWLLLWLPRPVGAWVGARLGDLYFRASPKRRKVAEVNLTLCFPDMPEQERADLIRRHFRAYGQSVVDMTRAWWASPRHLESYIKFKGLEHYRHAREAGREVILLTGHFVGIDVGGPVISRHYKQIGLIKPIHNEVIDWVLARGRVRFGSKMLLRKDGMRQVVKAIREGYGFSYVPDEDFGPEKSVFVPFFATQAPTITAVSKLARMCDAVVIPCFIWRVSTRDGYVVDMQPPLDDFPSGDDVQDAHTVRQVLQRAVEQHPEQYMWTFKFFKTRPDGAPNPYN